MHTLNTNFANMIITALQTTRRPDITFYANGRIDIASRLSKMLGIQEGDVIDIAKVDTEFLLYVRKKASAVVGRHEGQVHATYRSKRRCNNLRTYSRRMCKFVTAACADILRLPVGSPIEDARLGVCCPIITRNPIQQ